MNVYQIPRNLYAITTRIIGDSNNPPLILLFLPIRNFDRAHCNSFRVFEPIHIGSLSRGLSEQVRSNR